MKILFASYGAGHVKALIPVAEELKKRGHDVIFFAFTTAFHELKKYDFKVYKVSDFIHLIDKKTILKLGNKYFNGKKSKLVSYKETISYYGLGMFDLIKKFDTDKAERLYLNKERHAFNPIDSMGKVLDFLDPDILISTNSPRYERAIIKAARIKKIYSIVINDLFAIDEFKWLSKNNFGNKICVVNNYVKDFLVEKGRKPDSIVVTGNPNFISRKKKTRLAPTKKTLKEFYKIKKNQKVILWASQTVPEINKINGLKGDKSLPNNILKKLFEISAYRKDLFFITRMHPSEKKEFKINETDNFIVSKKDDVYDDILISNIAIVINSSIGYQAFLEQKKIIQVINSNLSNSSPYSKMGIASALEDINFFEEKLDFVLSEDYIEKGHNYRNLNKSSTQVISNLIEESYSS